MRTACGVTAQHTGYCWGMGTAGQLGNGAAASSPIPVQVAGAAQFQAIVTGADFACGLATTGTVSCWEREQRLDDLDAGELGTGDTVSSTVPRPIAGKLTFRSISAGLVHMCGVTTSGTAECWNNKFLFSWLGKRIRLVR